MSLKDDQGAARMSLDRAAVQKIATLARIKVPDAELDALKGELETILAWVEQLGEVDVSNAEAMTSVRPMELRRRADKVTDGNIRDEILVNAPEPAHGFFTVPKVVE
jgi:aspartyl-tRNA(Asn)/glutamyl-tRNA(Gln) amidotransferase subunit C